MQAMRKVTDALYYYHEAVKVNPEDAESMLGYATILNETSPTRAREAVDWLRAAVQVSPGFTEAKRTLAMVLTDIGVRLKHAGLPSDAFQVYMDALVVSPTASLTACRKDRQLPQCPASSSGRRNSGRAAPV